MDREECPSSGDLPDEDCFDIDKQVEMLRWLREKTSEDEFLTIVASVFVQAKRQEIEIEEYLDKIDGVKAVLEIFTNSELRERPGLAESVIAVMSKYEEFGAREVLEGISLQKKTAAIRAVKKKLANDPKQEAKRLVRECWDAWQNEATRYKNQAKFARDMLDKFPELENQASIEKWCREWKKLIRLDE